MVPNRVMGGMVLYGGGHFIPAGIFGSYTLSLLLSSQAAHDRAAVDSHTHNITQLNTLQTSPSITAHALQRHCSTWDIGTQTACKCYLKSSIILPDYKKNFLVAMGLQPGVYILNHNISVFLPCFITLSQLLLKQIRNYDTTVGLRSCGKYKILGCAYRTLSLVSTGYEKKSSIKLESYSELTMKKNTF